MLDEFGDDGCPSVDAGLSGEASRVDEHSRTLDGHTGLTGIGPTGGDHRAHRKTNCPSKIKISLIVPGHTHDHAGSVACQHVIGGVHRNPFAADGIDREPAEEHAGRGAIGGQPFDIRGTRDFVAIGIEAVLAVRGAQLGRQRRVDGHHHKRCPEHSLGTGAEHTHRFVAALDRKVDVGTFGSPDPIALHGQDFRWPSVLELRHVVEQSLGVVGDLEKPMRERPFGHLRPAPFAAACDDLLVGQHGLVVGAPIHRGISTIGQSAFVQPQEQPLVPAVVLQIAGMQAGAPVEGDPQPPKRIRLRLDIGVGPIPRVEATLERGVLRG